MNPSKSRQGPLVLGIIPARGGSKGVPNKNIRLLNGKPLIAYTIAEAKKSQRISHIITSTDSAAIAGVAAKYDSEVILRPPALAQDATPMVPVAMHALDVLKTRGQVYDHVILLQPTCPLRTAKDIDESLELLATSSASAVISVYRVFDEHPARMYHIDDDRLVPYSPAQEKLNRQDLNPVYHRNGSLYAIKEANLRKENTFFPQNSLPYLMTKERSINIDEEIDFLFAEFLMNHCFHAQNP